MSAFPGLGAPHIETLSGPRYDLTKVLPWCRERGIGNLDGVPASNGSTPTHADTEALDRMKAVVCKAIREHLLALASDEGTARLRSLLAAAGLDDRAAFIAVRMAQLWAGTSAPVDPFFVLDEPSPRSREAEWEVEVREALGASLRSQIGT